MKTKWILLVELHQFHNLYNAEMIDNHGICCCDTTLPWSTSNYYCNTQVANLTFCNQLTWAACDTWLNASVSHCLPPFPCSFSTETHTETSSVDNMNDIFVFVMSSSPNTVSVSRVYAWILCSVFLNHSLQLLFKYIYMCIWLHEHYFQKVYNMITWNFQDQNIFRCCFSTCKKIK